MKMTIWERVLSFLLIALVLCVPAFYNGFPLLFPDTIGYIETGFENIVGEARLSLYAVFLRHTSLWESLWLVVFVQGLIVTGTVYLMFKYFFQEKYTQQFFVLYLLLIGATTALSFHTSRLMPDIFTPIVILSFCLLLLAPNMTRKDFGMTALLFVFSTGTHNSHMVLVIGLFLVLSFGMLFKHWRSWYQSIGINLRKLTTIALLIVGTYAAVGAVEYSKGGAWSGTRGGGIFLFARLCDFGIAQAYLKENCVDGDSTMAICEHVDALGLSRHFLWSGESYLNKNGGWTTENKAFYSQLTRKILTSPRYLKRYIVCSVEAMFMQFFYYEYSPLAEMRSARHIGFLEQTTRYFPYYYWAVYDSLQLKAMYSDHYIKMQNLVQELVIGLSGLLLLLLFMNPKYKDDQKAVALFIIVGLLVNAFITGATSGVYDRYQSRVAWLLTLPAFWYAYEQLKQLKKMLFPPLQSNDSPTP